MALPHRAVAANPQTPAVDPQASGPSDWWLDRQVAHDLYPIVRRSYLSGDQLDTELASLASAHGDVVFAELIFMLAQLKLDPAQAHYHWMNIREHRAALARLLEHPPDIRVVLMSYFLDVHRRLERPKIVEMDWVEHATASAYLDEVTGLPNQRFFREQFERELKRSLVENSPLSLVFIDADDFKSVNDRYGHEAGNAALLALARLLRQHVTDRALVARYGGEEFVIVSPATPKHEAAELAERVRAAIAGHAFDLRPDRAPVTITVSLGVATCPADARTGDALVRAADTALYSAKGAGKNRVTLYGASTRSFGRRRMPWEGQLRSLAEPVDIAGVEIGDGGLVFRTSDELAADALAEVSLVLPTRGSVTLAGRIVWSRRLAEGGWECALRVIEQGVADRHRLAEWVDELSDAPADPPDMPMAI
jgi:diguanylate cyclase (GGDEF)-like protein